MAKQQKDQVIGRPKKNIDPEVVEKLASMDKLVKTCPHCGEKL